MIRVNTYFNFTDTPFTKSIDTNSLFITEAHKEILNRLYYSCEEQSFTVFTSKCGIGKTTLIRKFINDINFDKYKVFYVSDSSLTPSALYQNILVQLGEDSRYFRANSKEYLHEQIGYIKNKLKKKIVLIIDEAHLLSIKSIEEIRFLLNFKIDSFSPLSLILVGQTELITNLKRKQFTAIRQRVDIVCSLTSFNIRETEEYIKHHLRIVNYKDNLFTKRAIELIHYYSSGIARVINKIVKQCLLFCAIKNSKVIDKDIVEYVCMNEII